jgi:hypothetical protein
MRIFSILDKRESPTLFLLKIYVNCRPRLGQAGSLFETAYGQPSSAPKRPDNMEVRSRLEIKRQADRCRNTEA